MGTQDIILYLFDLKRYDYLLEEIEKYSTSEERRQAKRYSSPKDSYKLLSFMLRRIVLSRILDCDAQDIKYKFNEFGKVDEEEERLYFNVSYSENWLALAISFTEKIGIDIEVVKYIPKLNSFLESFCTPKEIEYIDSFPNIDKEYRALIFWTVKESLTKVLGKGLQMKMKELQFNSYDLAKGNYPNITWVENIPEISNISSTFVLFTTKVDIIMGISVYNIHNHKSKGPVSKRTIQILNPDLTSKELIGFITP